MGSEQSHLSLDSLNNIERALRGLLEAVQVARGDGLSPDSNSPHGAGLPPSLLVAELCNEFLDAKAVAGRSDRYIGELHKQLRSFAAVFGARSLASVRSVEIEHWLYAKPWADKTRHGCLLTLRTLFAFAVARQYLVTNPAKAVDLPQLVPTEIGVHSPAQVRAVLESVKDPSTLRYLAIRYFAGLRGSEAAKLEEEEIHTESGLIVVAAAKAKTRRRRLVTIQPCLRAWLDLSHERGGSLPLRQVNNRLCAAVKESGVPWPDNVTRHSFCSYHLAGFGSAAQTALQAGHTEQMLFKTYRELKTVGGELITPARAEEFWKIVPG